MPKITRLVCSGGGAKGIVYAGAYQALTETRIIDEITEVAGASAGAITAALIAIGVPVDKFRQILLENNFENLLGQRVPGAVITRDGEPLLDLLRAQIYQTLSDFFLQNAKIIQDRTSIDLTGLKQKVFKTGSITFKDLKLLCEHFPEKFKKLTVTAIQYPGGELQVFNAELTPNVEIALACRASASIPVILQPTTITLNDKKQQYADGGFFDNLPSDYFDKDDKGQFTQNNQKDNTLILAFGEGLDDKKNPVRRALDRSNYIDKCIIKTLLEESVEDLNNTTPPALLLNCMKQRLEIYVSTKIIAREQALLIEKAIQELPQPLDKQDKELVDKIQKKLTPRLYYANRTEKFKRDTFVEWFGGFKTKYKNVERKEIGFQKLRHDYPNQTVELRVGNITTTDFPKAKKIAREMIAMGYLDTMKYQYKGNKTASAEFYKPLLEQFKRIHLAIILASKPNSAEKQLFDKIKAYEQDNQSAQMIINELIKPFAEKNMKSSCAFALSRAVEFSTKKLNEENLLVETHKHSKNQQWISRTKFQEKNSATLIRKYKNELNNIQSDAVKRSEIIAEALFSPTRKP